MRRIPLYFPLCVAACAQGGMDPDAAPRIDARVRADASFLPDGAPGPDASHVDAGPNDPDASMASPDASVPVPDAGSILGTLILSEIVDADQTGGVPKFVEVTNVGTGSMSLSGYEIGVYANGSSSGNVVALSGTLAAGDSYVMALASGSGFNSVYGGPPDATSSLSFNGNDAVALLLEDVVVDSYGVIGTDGAGTPWEYTDGFAVRRPNDTTPRPDFNSINWAIAAQALADQSAAGTAGSTSPGTHTFAP